MFWPSLLCLYLLCSPLLCCILLLYFQFLWSVLLIITLHSVPLRSALGCSVLYCSALIRSALHWFAQLYAALRNSALLSTVLLWSDLLGAALHCYALIRFDLPCSPVLCSAFSAYCAKLLFSARVQAIKWLSIYFEKRCVKTLIVFGCFFFLSRKFCLYSHLLCFRTSFWFNLHLLVFLLELSSAMPQFYLVFKSTILCSTSVFVSALLCSASPHFRSAQFLFMSLELCPTICGQLYPIVVSYTLSCGAGFLLVCNVQCHLCNFLLCTAPPQGKSTSMYSRCCPNRLRTIDNFN